jgi:hypothetical protein
VEEEGKRREEGEKGEVKEQRFRLETRKLEIIPFVFKGEERINTMNRTGRMLDER